ncbi:MAG: DUF4397 domain-containing protein, partial [Flavobacteriales bacterium]
NGVLNPGGFGANPGGLSTAFQLLLKPGVFESSSSASTVRLYALHGTTDAPPVDVLPQGSGTPLVDNIAYGSFSSDFELPNASYYLDVTPATNNSIVVATYLADLTTLGGGAGMIFASGFLDPTTNQNGPGFGLYVVLPNGTVFPLPTASFASVQLIHNAADPIADTVDVYAGSTLLIDDIAFRNATSFLTVPAGVDIPVGIALSNSTSAADTLPGLGTTINLTAGTSYAIVANGVVDTTLFAANPDARSIRFTYFVKSGVQQTGSMPTDVDFVVLHGASDAPTVDVRTGSTVLVDDAAYGDITNYLMVPAASYILDVTPAVGAPVVAQFTADLSTLGGGAAVVFASGFLNPSQNQNGAAFGLFAALPNGSVVEFPPYVNTNARVQIIHNSADPVASSVDVYAGATLLIDDFDFREATAFLDVQGGIDIPIGIAPATSTSAADTIPTLGTTINLGIGNKYVILANGVTNPSNFAANPDGRSTQFTYFVLSGALEVGSDPGSVDVAVVHGSSDAPTVDVIASGFTLVDNAAYGDISSYNQVPAVPYVVDITAAPGAPTIVSYDADLTSLAGSPAVVFASGFIDPSTNQNGPAFGLFAALPNGTVIPFTLNVGVDELTSAAAVSVYPNPSSDRLNVVIGKEVKGASVLKLSDITGQVVSTMNIDPTSEKGVMDVKGLAAGMYHLSVVNESGVYTRPVIIKR